jgi:hypothetical protein
MDMNNLYELALGLTAFLVIGLLAIRMTACIGEKRARVTFLFGLVVAFIVNSAILISRG